MKQRFGLVFAIGIAAGSAAGVSLSPAAAQVADGDYNANITHALEEFNAGNFEEAAALFEAAHAQHPSARTQRGLGLAYFEGRHYALAVRHLRASLTDTRRPLTAEQRNSTQEVLKRAERFVAHIELTLDPAATKLQVDGHPAEIEGNELLLDGGRHELIATAPGRVDDRRLVDASAGSTSELVITLARAAGARASGAANKLSPEAATQASAASKHEGRRIAPFLVMGAGGAVAVAGIVTGVMVNGLHSDLEKRCTSGCTTSRDTNDIHEGKTLVTMTNVFLAGGLVTLAAGTAWWIWGSKRDRDSEPREPRVSASAVCLPGACGASVHGQF